MIWGSDEPPLTVAEMVEESESLVPGLYRTRRTISTLVLLGRRLPGGFTATQQCIQFWLRATKTGRGARIAAVEPWLWSAPSYL